jgi:Putative inner membrane protein (DUF1819)
VTALEPLTAQWRAPDVYTSRSTSKTGLLEETRTYLTTYDRLRDHAQVRAALVRDLLPQRSYETRRTIVNAIQQRLVRWLPPPWVLDDLIAFAHTATMPDLASALLVHVARQDALIYAVVQQQIYPLWQRHESELSRSDVQQLLDRVEPEHPEVMRWTVISRQKLAGNVLSILSDYGLLSEHVRRRITAPLVTAPVATHLVRLLLAEGVAADQIAHHPDWRLWLWDSARANHAVATTQLRRI